MTTSRRDFLAVLGATALTAGCASDAQVRGSRGYSVPIIDAHAHWYPREFVTLLEKEGEANGAKMGRDARGNTVVLSVPGGTQTSVLRRNMIEPDLLIAEMDERGRRNDGGQVLTERLQHRNEHEAGAHRGAHAPRTVGGGNEQRAAPF